MRYIHNVCSHRRRHPPRVLESGPLRRWRRRGLAGTLSAMDRDPGQYVTVWINGKEEPMVVAQVFPERPLAAGIQSTHARQPPLPSSGNLLLGGTTSFPISRFLNTEPADNVSPSPPPPHQTQRCALHSFSPPSLSLFLNTPPHSNAVPESLSPTHSNPLSPIKPPRPQTSQAQLSTTQSPQPLNISPRPHKNPTEMHTSSPSPSPIPPQTHCGSAAASFAHAPTSANSALPNASTKVSTAPSLTKAHVRRPR